MLSTCRPLRGFWFSIAMTCGTFFGGAWHVAAYGGIVVAFNPLGVNQDFQIQVGDTIDIPVYLVQSAPTTTLTDVGMVSSGITVSYSTATTGPSIPQSASLAAHWDDSGPLGLNRVEVDVISQTIVLEGAVVDLFSPVKSLAIQLGTLTFQSGDEGNVTNLSLSLTNANTPLINLLGDIPSLSELVPDEFRSGTITTVPIPEPSSMALVALGAFLAVRSRSRQ